MAKSKKIILTLLAVILFLTFILISVENKIYVKADTDSVAGETPKDVYDYDEGIERYGLFTSLTLTLDGEYGEVWANVHNDFTLFPATIYVIVELYSSDTYQESYKNMTVESTNYTKDLNMGENVTTKASTNGVQKYWKARMYYKMDSKEWIEKVTDTILLSADGIYVM